MLVGNKLDEDSERQITIEMGEELATKLKIPFFETSAKENVNITEVFETLVRHVLKVMIKYICVCVCANYLAVVY